MNEFQTKLICYIEIRKEIILRKKTAKSKTL